MSTGFLRSFTSRGHLLVLVRLKEEMTSEGVSITAFFAWFDAGYTLTDSCPYYRWQFCTSFLSSFRFLLISSCDYF